MQYEFAEFNRATCRNTVREVRRGLAPSASKSLPVIALVEVICFFSII